jgi:nucleotide-binding universal stress UspA family protein
VYHKILVPLDGSKRAEAILPHVEELARRYEAEVILLEVVELPVLMLPDSVSLEVYQIGIDRVAEAAQAYLTELKESLESRGITARMLIGDGPVVAAIIDAAEREEADLIALASHGRTGLPSVFYGSVAMGVLHRVDRPLLLIRSLDEG